MKKVRILALVHDHLVPPEDTTGIDIVEAEWKMEYDVIETLREMGHTVHVLGIHDDLRGIRRSADAFKPHIIFNLMEAFADVTTFDQNVVSYLELLHLPYTGCNPRGLMLARDKALSKKLLAYHRIPVPEFTVVRPGRTPSLRKRLTFPLIVKSLFFEASAGISQASVVENDDQLARRVTFIHDCRRATFASLRLRFRLREATFHDAAMAVTRVFAKTDVRDHDQLGQPVFDGLHGLLDDAGRGIGLRTPFIFFLRETE